MSSGITVSDAALDRLKRNWPYLLYTEGQLAIIGKILKMYLLSRIMESTITATDLILEREAFIALCDEELMELWIAEKGKFGLWKHFPKSTLRMTQKSKIDRLIQQATNKNLDLMRQLLKLPPQLSNKDQLDRLFPNGFSYPSTLTLEQLLLDYPWLLLDCFDWLSLFE